MRKGTAAALCVVAVGACDADRNRETTLVEVGGSRPTVAVTDSGAVLVAWVETANVMLARSEDGIAFDAPMQVNDVAGDAAPHEQAPAQVAVSHNGDVYVAWQNNTHAEGRRFPYSDLRFARSLDGGRRFQPAVTVNDDADGPPSSHTFHTLIIAADGTIYVSWIDGRATADEHHGGGSGPQIRIARSTDRGTSFSKSILVAEGACPCCRTAMAAGPEGRLAVAWRSVRDGDVRDIVVSRSEDGGETFSAPVVVHEDGWRIDGCPHAGPSLAVDGEGRLHVAWYTGAEGGAGVFHAVSTDGGTTFGHVRPLMAGEWVPVSLVSLATDAGGRVWAAWDDRRVDPVTVNVVSLDGGDETSLGGRAPSLAAAAGLRAVSVIDGDAVKVRTWRQ